MRNWGMYIPIPKNETGRASQGTGSASRPREMRVSRTAGVAWMNHKHATRAHCAKIDAPNAENVFRRIKSPQTSKSRI